MNDILVLKEVYKNSSTGVYSMKKICEKIEDKVFFDLISEQKDDMQKIVDESEQLLISYDEQPDDIGLMSKSGIVSSIMFKTISDNSPSNIADILIKGNSMGINNLRKVMNSAVIENNQISRLANELLSLQENNIERLKNYL